MIISQASPIAQQQVHMMAIVGKMVGLLGIFNAAGRFFWGRGILTISAVLASIFCFI